MEYVHCNLCGADSTVVRHPSTIEEHPTRGDWSAYACTHSGYGRHHTIVQCRQCGLVYTNPRLDRGDIANTYQAVEDPLYVEEREGRVLTFEHHLKPLERIAGSPGGRPLLDVGCYTGVFVEIAARHGWDAWGVEPSHWAVEQAQARGLHVVQGTLDAADLPEAFFDVVTLWDVIEHLVDPMAEVRRVWRLLKPGGLIVIHTMDITSPTARLLGRRWPFLMEMHLFYLSRKTLCAILEKAGFEVVKIHTQGRYLRLGYLTGRMKALWRLAGCIAEWIVNRLKLQGVTVAVNTLDLFTAYGRKAAA